MKVPVLIQAAAASYELMWHFFLLDASITHLSICRESTGGTFLHHQNVALATNLAPAGQTQEGCRKFNHPDLVVE